MTAEQLPTWNEIRQHARGSLTETRRAATDTADWLRSDWHPSSPPPTGFGDAKAEVYELVGQIKELVDQAQQALDRVEER